MPVLEILFLTHTFCFRDSLGRENVKEVKMSDRQHSQPAVVTVENLTTLRRYVCSFLIGNFVVNFIHLKIQFCMLSPATFYNLRFLYFKPGCFMI